MNILTVEFHGMCVHFNREGNPSLGLPAAHRVVLTYLPNGLHWNGHKIQEHLPEVTVNDEPLAISLGATLSLGQLMDESRMSSTFRCPPSLLSVHPDMVLNVPVIVDEAPPAAIYFDINEGVLNGIDIGGSAGTKLTIETEAAEAVLNIDQWDGTSFSLTIGLPATIVVSNMTKEKKFDDDADFIISFAVGKPFPPEPTEKFTGRLKTALEAAMGCLKSDSQDIGPGCSNSQFP